MMDGHPSLDFILNCIDEVFLSERLVLGEIDLLNEVFLLDHLTGQKLASFAIDCQVGSSKAALAQFTLFDMVMSIYHF